MNTFQITEAFQIPDAGFEKTDRVWEQKVSLYLPWEFYGGKKDMRFSSRAEIDELYSPEVQSHLTVCLCVFPIYEKKVYLIGNPYAKSYTQEYAYDFMNNRMRVFRNTANEHNAYPARNPIKFLDGFHPW